MDDLVTWLRAQLDEDERVAREATAGPWHLNGHSVAHSGPSTSASNERWGHYIAPAVGAYDGGHPTSADAEHIALHDPARVLAEVDAKRRILAEHPVISEPYRLAGRCERCCSHDDEVAGEPPVTHPCPTVRLLALPYATRPGYRQEWRP